VTRRALTFVAALGFLASSCGYHSLAGSLPGGARSVRVVVPDPVRTGEPDLAQLLTAELVRQLARSGIRASSTGAADSVLVTRLFSLDTTDSPLDRSGQTVGARALRLRLELHLSDRAGSTLWRSGPLEVEDLWPLSPSEPRLSEESRRRTLLRLAIRAAEQGVELLTSGL